MTAFATEVRRRMHRHSDEDVAAVVTAALAELRARSSGSASVWDGVPPGVRAVLAERIRLIRSGVLPRDQYEAASRPGDPPYDALPVSRRDEDQVEWLLTQALTGD